MTHYRPDLGNIEDAIDGYEGSEYEDRSTVLLACPFCGEVADITYIEPHEHLFSIMPKYEGGAFAECRGCGAALAASSVEELKKKWNARTR